MTTVLLLGCSGAGKSTILREVERLVEAGEWPNVECLDSDREIAHPDGGHIYNIHFQHGRLAATHVIATRERGFLQSLPRTNVPRIIAAGPALVSREPEFGEFAARVMPACIYLEQTPESVLEALKRRRERHAIEPEVAQHRWFGSWDAGIRTRRQNDGTFAVLPDSEAIVNVRKECAPLMSKFERLTSPASRFPAIQGPDDNALAQVLNHVRTVLFGS